MPTGTSPLTEEQIYEVRDMWDNGISREIIAKKFNIHKRSVARIGNRYFHTHLPERNPNFKIRTSKAMSKETILKVKKLRKQNLKFKEIAKIVGITERSAQVANKMQITEDKAPEDTANRIRYIK